ncbi:TPA: hypothetical protein ACQZ9I_004367 [Klebsiella pneumoniae]
MTYKNEVFIGIPKTKPKALQEAMIEGAPWYTVILGVFGRFLRPLWASKIQPKVEGSPLR